MSDYLPLEAVTEILLRIPVKPLLKFRTVCKDWLCIISNPNFITKHINTFNKDTNSKTLVRHYSKIHSKEQYHIFNSFNDIKIVKNIKIDCTRVSFLFNEQTEYYYRIVGYCNGVLCFSDDLFKNQETGLVLWNPSIKKAVTLPLPRVVFNKYGPYMFALGFGFDSVTNDFKVVRVVYMLPGGVSNLVIPPKVEVFSVKTGVWKFVKNSIDCYVPTQFWSQVFYNGAVHWCAFKKSSVRNGYGKFYCNVVLRFDLGNEKFTEMALPEDLAGVMPVSLFVTTVKGCFAVVCNDFFVKELFNKNSACKFVVFVMKEYGNVVSWTRLLNVELDTGLSMMLKFGGGGDGTLFSGKSGELVSYDFGKKRVTGSGMFGTKYSFFADKYVESLALMDKGRVFKGKEPELDRKDEDEMVEQEEYKKKVLAFSLNTSTIMSFNP